MAPLLKVDQNRPKHCGAGLSIAVQVSDEVHCSSLRVSAHLLLGERMFGGDRIQGLIMGAMARRAHNGEEPRLPRPHRQAR